jgi:general secretion pathway protein G
MRRNAQIQAPGAGAHAPRQPARAPAGDAGFTLLELLVVLGILALLATLAGPQVLRYMGRAKTETARAQISSISTALELYSLDHGGFPQQQAGLQSLVRPPPDGGRWRGPYLKRTDGLVDPWGRPYQYRHPGRNAAAEVFTFGRDNAPGGTGEDQDLTNW